MIRFKYLHQELAMGLAFLLLPRILQPSLKLVSYFALHTCRQRPFVFIQKLIHCICIMHHQFTQRP